MDLKIAGRTALVTGSSSGIGRAIALALAAEGVRLALAARRLDQLEEVAAEARARGAAEAAVFALDIADPHSVAALHPALRKAFGDPDIVILNGGGPKAGRFSELALEDWDRAYRLLLRGMLQLLEIAVPPMRARKWGRVVALTSTSVKQPIDNLTLSNAFRTALVAALRTLAVEVAPDGVTVNAIATGRIDTPRLRELYGNDEAKLRAAGAEVPIGRTASPEEFAPMAAFLCGEPAGYVTGQTISVDGGLVRYLFG
ncbi:MAG TPA: SDR family oxidoreductase [Candidatus Cybelea sp.]|jgi:3-oxoacyl-[acyl-carrier protein] reductase|nr:SDR family oxidoreductase [Candidatus Cybelea sp.]